MHKGQDVGVNLYVYKHEEGVVYLYENLSAEFILEESISWKLKNCGVEGTKKNAVVVHLRPNTYKRIDINRTEMSEDPFEAVIDKCTYSMIKK